MKITHILLMVSSTLYADTLFLIPHQWHDARHRIGELFHHAPGPLTIVTDTLQDGVLRHALQKRIDKGQTVTLMTPSRETASRWAIYRNLHVCILADRRALGYSIAVAGKEEGCLFTDAFSTAAFRRGGMMQCSDAADYAPAVEQLKKECRPYFTPGL